MSEDSMANPRACPWGEDGDHDPAALERRQHLNNRLASIEEKLGKQGTGNAQWVSVLIAFLVLAGGAWSVTQRLENRITKLETSIEYMHQALVDVSNQLRADAKAEARREQSKL